MLLRLILKNFKKHALLDVEFGAGTNGIYGPNYKGKSTLLMAILYALGGSSHVPGTRLARRGSDGRFSVELAWQDGDDVYNVVRTKSSANLYKNGDHSPVATGTSAVTDEIERLIGMSVKQWKELHYAKQKNAHSLLRYSANNLHQLMRRLVGAEELDSVVARLKRMATREEGAIDQLGTVEGDVAECEETIAALNRLLLSGKKELQINLDARTALVECAAGSQKLLAQATELMLRLKDNKSAADQLQTRAAAAANTVERAENSVANRKISSEEADIHLQSYGEFDPTALEEWLEHRRNLASEQKNAKANYDFADEQLAARGSEVEVKARELVGIESAAAEVVSKAREALAEARGGDAQESIEQAATDAKATTARLAQEILSLQGALSGATCPTCKRPMEGHSPEELQAEIDALGVRLSSAREVEAEATARQTAVAALVKKLAEVEATTASQRSNAKDRLTRAEEELEKAISVQGQAERTLASWTLALEELVTPAGAEEGTDLTIKIRNYRAAVAASTTAKAELGRAESELATARTNLEDLLAKAAAVDLVALEAEIASTAESLNETRALLVTNNAEKEKVQKEVDRLTQLTGQQEYLLKRETDKKARIETQTAALEKAQKRLAKIQHLQKHLKEKGETYMAKAWAGFMVHASQFASLCTGGDIEELRRTEDGNFVFVEEGEEMQLEEASGAQEAIIGLAVQMALASAAPCNLNVLMLDEPTADMDGDCSMATMVALKQLGQQVVFVSHHHTDNAVCDRAINL